MEYIISAISNPFGEPVGGNVVEHDPQNAIIAWFRVGEKHPTCTSLQADSEASAFKLLEWADENKEKIEVWAKEHKCPYKVEWMADVISSYVKKGKSSIQWEFDEVSPFCMG